MLLNTLFFFFQAEDGIRDVAVTGVQTCALPIWACDIALGSDTGGSMRVPAGFCGIFGIRPTHGRIDTSGAMAMSPTFDVVGWFAPSAGLLRKTGSVLLEAAGDVRRPISRLLVLRDAFDQADAAVASALRN